MTLSDEMIACYSEVAQNAAQRAVRSVVEARLIASDIGADRAKAVAATFAWSTIAEEAAKLAKDEILYGGSFRTLGVKTVGEASPESVAAQQATAASAEIAWAAALKAASTFPAGNQSGDDKILCLMNCWLEVAKNVANKAFDCAVRATTAAIERKSEEATAAADSASGWEAIAQIATYQMRVAKQAVEDTRPAMVKTVAKLVDAADAASRKAIRAHAIARDEAKEVE